MQRQSTSDSTEFYIVVYNSLGWSRKEVISIPVDIDADYIVKERLDTNNWREVPSALVKNFNYARVTDAAAYNLMVDVEIDGLSARSYLISKVSKEYTSQKLYRHALLMDGRTSRNLRFAQATGDLVVENGKLDIHFSRYVLGDDNNSSQLQQFFNHKCLSY